MVSYLPPSIPQPNIVGANATDAATAGVANSAADGHCIWYGVCGNDKSKKQYCAYDGPAKQLDPAGQDLLRMYCPHVLERYQGAACCDNEMVSTTTTDRRQSTTMRMSCARTNAATELGSIRVSTRVN